MSTAISGALRPCAVRRHLEAQYPLDALDWYLEVG
jgi:hypothetical protein